MANELTLAFSSVLWCTDPSLLIKWSWLLMQKIPYLKDGHPPLLLTRFGSNWISLRNTCHILICPWLHHVIYHFLLGSLGLAQSKTLLATAGRENVREQLLLGRMLVAGIEKLSLRYLCRSLLESSIIKYSIIEALDFINIYHC